MGGGLNTCYFVVLLCVLTQIALAADLYRLLGVSPDADQGEIKRGYRKMSLQYHPDKNPGDEDAASKFAEIARAYEILSDETKRQIYDQQGEEEVERFEQGGDRRQKGPTQKLTVKATLEELYIGAHSEFKVSRKVYCNKCKGSGAEGGQMKICPTCKGSGQVTQNINMGMMQMQMQQPCNKCQGKGKTFAKVCPNCRGGRLMSETKAFQVDVERGMKNGDTILFERQGEQVPDMLQGDVVFQIQQSPHNVFKRVGNNLYVNVDITLEQALLGFHKTFQHLDGHTVDVRASGVSQPFSWQIIKGEGMPIRGSGGDYGDLHVKLVVQFPSKLSPKQQEIARKIFESDKQNVQHPSQKQHRQEDL